MADTKISELSAASALAGTEVVPVVQAGSTKKATLSAIAALSGTSGLKDFAYATRTAGNLTFSSATWSDLLSGFDLVLTAAVDDVVEVGINAYVIPTGGGQWAFLDVASIVSGSAVNIWSHASGTVNGISGWEIAGSRGEGPIGGSIMRTLVSGDISGGTVTLRLRCAAANAGNVATVRASTQNPLQWWAKNLGPIPA